MASEKLYEYEGLLGRFHRVRDYIKEKWNTWKEDNSGSFKEKIKKLCFAKNEQTEKVIYEDFSHIYR